MLMWIKSKIESLKFIRRPLKIHSYTDVKKERVFGDIDKFRSNVLNMNLDDIENGIKLLNHMGIDGAVNLAHKEAYYDLQEIKSKFNLMKSGAFDPSNPFSYYNSFYNNAYAQNSQAGWGSRFAQAYSQDQYGQQSQFYRR